MNPNLNDDIKVRLTDHGKDLLTSYYATLSKECKVLFPVPQSDAGVYTFQLWNFMHIFGESLFCGAKNVCENNEIFISLKGELNEA